ncbi:2-oxo-4-hydroxy-4-carboxy-5-ureidoimidazoline decarboxylase [Modestobacter marinus]|uniref:2-oxo-4-hydroxy-4-carboxy-5-ureidoimidazoline decarboxylase n=1 Tax=Modestobacter marinus TaxID=477641 RepID=UPI001C93DC09|nr:2-oxo-4-hydroxy-4-carboxy-5-ureidoimidazoline decarboxylase [Modestobacter marinus]
MPDADVPAALVRFNTEPVERVEEVLQAINAAPRFATELAVGRPYPDVDSLVARAEQVTRVLPWDEVAVALSAHPRIGDRVEGPSTEAVASRREQSGMDAVAARVRAAFIEGNRAYEQRFHHVFLIRAAGRSAEEMLAELRRRLTNDVATERAEVVEELAQITGLRVRRLVQNGAP